MSERIYYKIQPDSPVMNVIEAALERQETFRKAMKALQDEFGGEIWTADNAYFIGIQFKGDLPAGWRSLKSKTYAVPNERLKIGRELRRRFYDLPQGVNARVFSNMLAHALESDYAYWGDGHVYMTIYEKYGDTYVLSVPSKLEVIPPSCVKMKASEYWKIREDAGGEGAGE